MKDPRDVIVAPVVSEKSYDLIEKANTYTFGVDRRSNKGEIKDAVESIFEVSVLSSPKELGGDIAEIRKKIKIGRDGLVLRWKHGSGLLLPQVPVELKWTVEDYLANLCYKAGTTLDIFQESATTLSSFEAVAFKEIEPNGRILRVRF